MKVGRFINSKLDKNHLPKQWEHPGNRERHDGFQVLRLSRVLRMIDRGEDVRDDWYQGGRSYSHVSIIEVSGTSGDVDFGYQSCLPEDVESMRVMSLDRVKGYLSEIGCEMSVEHEDIEVDEMGWPVENWWVDHEEEVMERLVDMMDDVDPEFVSTLD